MVRLDFRRALLLALGCTAPSLAHAQALDYSTLAETMGEPVTASVTGKPQRASEAPASITIITREEIARSPARDVPGLLAAYAGIQVNRWTAGQSDVAVRGGVQTYNARLLVLVNGRQVYLDHYGMTNWNLLGVQLGDIQQIELVRGPASALYGFNAASGVVNIITVDPQARAAASATAEAGTKGFSRLNATASLPISDAVGVRISAGRQREDERDLPEALLTPPVGRVAADAVSGTLVATPGAGSRVEVSAGRAVARQLELLPSQLLSNQRFRNDTAGLKLDQDVDWGTVSANAYVNRLRARYVSDTLGIATSALLDNRIAVGSLSSLVRLDTANTLRLGLEYRNNRLDVPQQFSRRIGYDVGSASAMLDLHPSDAVAFSLAARIDRLSLFQRGTPVLPAANTAADFDRDLTTLSFNAAVLFSLDSRSQLRINGGRGVQSPSLVNFGIRIPTLTLVPAPLPVLITGDPGIEPAVVWSGELSLSRQIGDTIRLEAGAFYNRTQDAIASPGSGATPELSLIGGPSLVLRFANAGSFDTFGGTVSATGGTGPLRWQANYSWVHTDENVLYPAFALTPKESTPEHTVNVAASYSTDRWLASATARYASATRQLGFTENGVLELFGTDDAVGVDGRLGWRATPRLLLYVAGQNLGLARGAGGSPIPHDRRLRVGLTIES